MATTASRDHPSWAFERYTRARNGFACKLAASDITDEDMRAFVTDAIDANEELERFERSVTARSATQFLAAMASLVQHALDRRAEAGEEQS